MSHLEKRTGPDLVERLRAAGCRITPSRRAVLRVFAGGPAHVQPDDLLSRARRLHPGVGRATVYRTLELLTRLGVTRPLHGRDGKTCFARLEQGHQHAVCSRCDRVVELDGADFARLAGRVARRTGFAIHSQLLEFFGLCERCRKHPALERP